MLFDLIPIVIAWGTLALVIATYTPIFNWISYPMGLYLQLFGVEEAMAVAPSTLIGFADMFIPALLIGGIQSIKTKFVIGVLSLVQIIYLTEVGAIIIKSEIPLNLWKLFVVFLERTLIAIPLIVLFANLVL
jgi:nucleoside recognition membrane protein YjiH